MGLFRKSVFIKGVNIVGNTKKYFVTETTPKLISFFKDKYGPERNYQVGVSSGAESLDINMVSFKSLFLKKNFH